MLFEYKYRNMNSERVIINPKTERKVQFNSILHRKLIKEGVLEDIVTGVVDKKMRNKKPFSTKKDKKSSSTKKQKNQINH